MKIRLPAIRFALVGAIATLIHVIVGTGLIYLNIAPLVANIFGFLAAFSISFLGHYYFSFAGHGNKPGDTLARFIFVAAVGFAINETILASLLLFFPQGEMNALIMSTLTAAVVTFKMSQLWAFRKHSISKRECRIG